MDEKVFLCPSDALLNSGLAAPFDVVYEGLTCRAFAIRYEGQVHAYLNRCAHIPMEMDYQPDKFFDNSGKWLLCATHGAVYSPSSGQCVEGPCKGRLIKIEVSETDSKVYWHTNYNLKMIVF